jgi:hypothetical protein
VLVALSFATSVAAVEGEIVTESDGDASRATDRIGETSGNVIVHGRIVRKIVIKGSVKTRATRGGQACTSIASVGSCAQRSRGDSGLPNLESE